MTSLASEVAAVSPLVAVENEPSARLIVGPPHPGALAQGRVFIPYQTENLRVVPVFGKGALGVSPRIGHVHITVDDAPWHFIDASGQDIVLVGLEPGPHKVQIALADPAHNIIESHTVAFVVPDLGVR
jgi:catechol 2,3-dioxygenase-like lactoylglutathione lyase family enzyme